MTGHALREARTLLAVLIAAWLVAIVFLPWASLVAAAAIVFVLVFFRDPDRTPPADESLVVAPADGTVVGVDETEETQFLNSPVRRVVIFLSVLDVHINRAPIAGKITHSEPESGLFLDARDPHSSTKNARRTWVIDDGSRRIVVRQITGAIARRICAWKSVGDTVARAERFGMIRFGSRTEIDLPANADILVKVGDVLRGGETAVARLPTP